MARISQIERNQYFIVVQLKCIVIIAIRTSWQKKRKIELLCIECGKRSHYIYGTGVKTLDTFCSFFCHWASLFTFFSAVILHLVEKYLFQYVVFVEEIYFSNILNNLPQPSKNNIMILIKVLSKDLMWVIHKSLFGCYVRWKDLIKISYELILVTFWY